MRSSLGLTLRPLMLTRPDDIRLSAMLAAVAAGTVALILQLARVSRDVDTHAREVAKLWAETDDIRRKLFSIGENFVDALSSPPLPGDEQP